MPTRKPMQRPLLLLGALSLGLLVAAVSYHQGVSYRQGPRVPSAPMNGPGYETSHPEEAPDLPPEAYGLRSPVQSAEALLRVKVIDALAKTPLAGCMVKVTAEPAGSLQPRSARSDSSGVVTIPELDLGEVILVDVSHSGYASASLSLSKASKGEVTVALHPLAEIVGEVIRDGIPVEGALVLAEMSGASIDFPTRSRQLQAAGGVFRLGDVPIGATVRLTAWEGSQVSAVTTVQATEPRHSVSLNLEAGGSITGTVRTATGTPLRTLEVSAARSGPGGQHPGMAVTDHQGRFTIEGALAGTYVLTPHVTPGSRARAASEIVEVRPGQRTEVNMTVPEPSTVRGLVMDSDGAPLGEMLVELVQESDALATTRTLADGSFSLNGPHSSMATWVRAGNGPSDGYLANRVAAESDVGEVILRLEKAPLGSVYGELRGAHQTDGHPILSQRTSETPSTHELRLEGDTVPETRLELGEYELLWLTPLGQRTHLLDLDVLPESKTRIDLDLRQYRVVGGLTLDGLTGIPIPGVAVELRRTDSPVNQLVEETVSDSQGRFELRSPRDPASRVHALHEDYVQLESAQSLSAGDSVLTIRMVPAGRLEVVAPEGEHPCSASLQGSSTVLTAELTSEPGMFVFEGLAPGLYEVACEDRLSLVEIMPGSTQRISLGDGQAFRWSARFSQHMNPRERLTLAGALWLDQSGTFAEGEVTGSDTFVIHATGADVLAIGVSSESRVSLSITTPVPSLGEHQELLPGQSSLEVFNGRNAPVAYELALMEVQRVSLTKHFEGGLPITEASLDAGQTVVISNLVEGRYVLRIPAAEETSLNVSGRERVEL